MFSREETGQERLQEDAKVSILLFLKAHTPTSNFSFQHYEHLLGEAS